MTYRVIITPTARHELYQDALWWAEHRDSGQAVRWMEGFEKAILSLAENPEKHPLALESEKFPFEMRQMLYGLSRQPTHRALFEIRGDEVFVQGIRHLARRNLTPDDIM